MVSENSKSVGFSARTQLRDFQKGLPLAGGRPNAALSPPDDRILYLAAVPGDTPVSAPALAPEEWRASLDLLRPHGVYPLRAHPSCS